MGNGNRGAGDSSPHPGALDEQRRILELQLIQVRKEASAARLEARAAEIELTIRQLAAGVSSQDQLPEATRSTARVDRSHSPPRAPATHVPGFANWDEVRGASITESTQTAKALRVDSAESRSERPHCLAADETAPQKVAADPSDIVKIKVDEKRDDVRAQPSAKTKRPKTIATKNASSRKAANAIFSRDRVPSGDPLVCKIRTSGENADSQLSDAESRRRKPAAWLVSAAVHVGVLLILAAISLQAHRPRDQVAFSASAAESNEVSMETFTIESSEPEPESEPVPSETEYELSPVGEIAASDFAPEALPSPPSPAAAAITSSALSAAAAMSLQSDSDAKIQFCGVEGGGNHFVYLVDSSGSMGDGFESARAELLASIAALKPDQRFYVVFFDAESDYMRLRNPKQDEPQSVFATASNKTAVERWAMRIVKDKGRAPYDPLRFALKLKPDVIFLLSDGEFPQGIEDLLREENKVENLFGDQYPISIVHTIGYHSKEGESRMRRIAEQNKGQYRHIPGP